MQLYEVQVADNYAMSTEDTQDFLPKSQVTRFLRMDFGMGNQRHTEMADLDAIMDPTDPTTPMLEVERTRLEPGKYAAFKQALYEHPAGTFHGWADCLCAVVTGMPVSYFKDVYYENGETFPRGIFARTSEVGDQKDEKPIGGTEDPLQMPHLHRADFLPTAGGKYRHFNHMDVLVQRELEFRPGLVSDSWLLVMAGRLAA